MIDRSTNIKAALRSRQRGFLLNPYRFGSSSPPLPGSVVYLNHFDGEDGSTSLSDVTGKTYGLVGAGISLKTGQKKFGASSVGGFASSRSLSVLGIPIAGDADFTACAWIRWDGASGSKAIISLAGGGGTELYVSGGKLAFWRSSGAVVGTDDVPVNEWAFAALERKSGVSVTTLNGVIQGTYAGEYNNATERVNIGCWQHSSGSESFSGYIDEVLIRVGGTQFGGGAFTPPTEPFSV